MKTKTRIGGSMRDLGSWILHHNLLGGPLTPLQTLSQLQNLTLFANKFTGRLILPSNTCLMILYAQRNRLSCTVQATNVSLGTCPIDGAGYGGYGGYVNGVGYGYDFQHYLNSWAIGAYVAPTKRL